MKRKAFQIKCSHQLQARKAQGCQLKMKEVICRPQRVEMKAILKVKIKDIKEDVMRKLKKIWREPSEVPDQANRILLQRKALWIRYQAALYLKHSRCQWKSQAHRLQWRKVMRWTSPTSFPKCSSKNKKKSILLSKKTPHLTNTIYSRKSRIWAFRICRVSPNILRGTNCLINLVVETFTISTFMHSTNPETNSKPCNMRVTHTPSQTLKSKKYTVIWPTLISTRYSVIMEILWLNAMVKPSM